MVKFFINNTEVHPANRDEIRYRVNRDGKRRDLIDLSTDTLVFQGESKSLILSHLENVGIEVGLPIQVDFGGLVVQEYYIDFLQGLRRNKFEISVTVKRRNSTNHFFADADVTLFETVTFQSGDIQEMDIELVTEQQLLMFITLLMLQISLLQSSIDAIMDVVEAGADVQEASIPSISAAGVPVINIPLIISASLKLVGRVAKTVAIVLAFIDVTTQVVQIVLPPLFQLKYMRLYTLLQRGCEHLGYTFESTFLQAIPKLSVLPTPLINHEATIFRRKFKPLSLAFNKGFPSFGDGNIQTVGGLFDEVLKLFDLEIQVDSETKVVRLETESFFANAMQTPESVNYTQIDIKTLDYEIDTERSVRRRFLTFAVDSNDINTMDNAVARSAEDVYESAGLTAPDLNLIRGVDTINTVFSKGTRKENLTFAQEFLKTVASAIDFFTGGNLAQNIANRIGVMQVSEQYFRNPKLLLMNGRRIAPESDSIINARYILDNFHTQSRVFDRIDNLPIALSLQEFYNLSKQNFVNLEEIGEAEIMSAEWDEETKVCELSVRFPSIYQGNINKIKYD